MRLEGFTEATAKSARAVAVDDADAGLAGQGSLIEEFVHAASGFFDRETDHVDFVGGSALARLGMDRDAERFRSLGCIAGGQTFH